MKVFIENEAGLAKKNIYNEKTLEFKESLVVSRKYPYPYGFILNTTAPDGDNIDVFVITSKNLKPGDIVDCEPFALMEQTELSWTNDTSKYEVDHNVLAILKDDNKITITEKIKAKLTDFVLHVFDSIRINKTKVGVFNGKLAAELYIKTHSDD